MHILDATGIISSNGGTVCDLHGAIFCNAREIHVTNPLHVKGPFFWVAGGVGYIYGIDEPQSSRLNLLI